MSMIQEGIHFKSSNIETVHWAHFPWAEGYDVEIKFKTKNRSSVYRYTNVQWEHIKELEEGITSLEEIEGYEFSVGKWFSKNLKPMKVYKTLEELRKAGVGAMNVEDYEKEIAALTRESNL